MEKKKKTYDILLLSPWTATINVNPSYQLIRNEINRYTRQLVKKKLQPFLKDVSTWNDAFGDTARYQEQYPYCPGLLSIAGFLEDAGYRVGCFSLDVERERYNCRDWLQLFLEDNCSPGTKAVGITAVTPEYNRAISVLKKVKRFSPDILTIIGGTHVTYYDREAISEDSVDVVVRQEGEQTLLSILIAREQGRNFNHINGVTFKQKGNIVKTPDAPLIDLEQLPLPAYHLLDRFTLSRIHLTPTYTRGCPFNCSYCVESTFFNRTVRSKSPKKFVEEIKKIISLTKVKIIHIADSTFGIDRESTIQLCNELEKHELDIVFSVNLRPDVLKYMGVEILSRLVKLNFLEFYVGMESADDELLGTLNRLQKYSDFLDTLKNLKKLGVPIVKIYLIIGIPGDTHHSIQNTLDKIRYLLKEELIFYATGKFFVPVIGTKQFESACDFFPAGIKWNEHERYKFPPVSRIDSLSPFEVEHYLCLLQAIQLGYYRRIVGPDTEEISRIEAWADKHYIKNIYL